MGCAHQDNENDFDIAIAIAGQSVNSVNYREIVIAIAGQSVRFVNYRNIMAVSAGVSHARCACSVPDHGVGECVVE